MAKSSQDNLTITNKLGLGLLLALFCLAPLGCGSSSQDQDEEDAPSSQVEREADGTHSARREARVPVETFLVQPRSLPNQVRAASLTLRFRSNINPAQFECAVGREEFQACPAGDAYHFDNLVHGRAYSLKVRARQPGGDVDLSPLELSFGVDRLRGQDPEGGRDVVQPNPDDLPGSDQAEPVADVGRPDDVNPVANRSLQVGSFYAVTAPYEFVATSYATTKTYNNALRLIRLLDEHAGTAYWNEPCQHSWEREVIGQGERRYCDATPNKSQHAQAYRTPMPYNHVELVRGMGPRTNEKLLVAAFDEERDPVEYRLGLGQSCRNAEVKGTEAVGVLNEFFGLDPRIAMFHWCQSRDPNGDWWWVGTFGTRLGRTQNAPRLRAIYAIRGNQGISSGAQFADRAGRLLTQVIVPLAPTPGEENRSYE